MTPVGKAMQSPKSDTTHRVPTLLVPVLYPIHWKAPQFREIGDLQVVAVAFGEYL